MKCLPPVTAIQTPRKEEKFPFPKVRISTNVPGPGDCLSVNKYSCLAVISGHLSAN